ncbi:glycosyltransferase [Xenorhabdus japonica]|uniref:Glycosyltransferase 2-like domain-containing protein n=1 Tax=Xenorhabdus japonica TaxID=53341 RepID=A0A1I5E6G5_9GAMM|nr:glycosyltransferase [Xenorhabdus japonica]SFO06943.1 hypothetical protein SAMN05421579_15514 [Xenorhabdus japonica]
MTKEIAVLMCVYYKDNFVFFEEAVESVLSQSENLDLYIYTDGAICSELCSSIEKFNKKNNIFVYSGEKNIGLARALNKLIDIVLVKEYAFIARMDSDDISLPGRFCEQVNFLKNNTNIDVCGTFCSEFGSPYAITLKKLPTSHEQLVDFSITRCPFVHPTVLFRRRVFENSKIRYPTDTNLTEDMSLWFELLKEGYFFANVDKVLLKYRLSESTLLRRRGIKKASSEIKIRFNNMFTLKKVSLKNVFLLVIKFFLHIAPMVVIKFAYKKMR